MDFPIVELMNADACSRFLLELLHPDGLRCSGCRGDDFYAHDRHRDPVFDYRCRACGTVFNLYPGTPFQKTHRTPSQRVLILRGICQGTPTAQLARELECDRKWLLALRHRLQGLAELAARMVGPVAGPAVEADEMFQNAGEKRHPAPRPRRSAASAGQ